MQADSLFFYLILSIAIQLAFFIFAFLLRTDKFTDLAYGASFIILSWLALFLKKEFTIFGWALVVMITIWGVRISGYLFFRILFIKRDKRFDSIRTNFRKFLVFWLLQGLSVWIILLPAIVILGKTLENKINLFMLTGILLWLFGITIETIADIQKFKFKISPDGNSRWIESGLWKYSRHPNYLGEILCWVGIFVVSSKFLHGLEWLTIISPIYIIYLLLFLTGIPTLEKRYDKKYGENDEYLKYKSNTPKLIPLFWKIKK